MAKDKISSKQAEKAYLKHWVKNGSNSYAPKASELKHPVTNVSWFAANAYCVSKGKRLPTIDEWEFAGLASTTQKMALPNPATTAPSWIGMQTAAETACTTSVKTNPTTGAYTICTA